MKGWLTLALLTTSLGLSQAAAASSQQRDSYIGKAQAELDRWGAEAQELQTRSQRAGAQTRVELDRRLNYLEEKIQAAKNKLDRAIADVRRSYREAAAYFKKHAEKR